MSECGTPGCFGIDDLDVVVARAASAFELLASSRIFITGGTGFIGRWLVAALLHARREMRRPFDIVVLSRDPEAFLRRHPSFVGRDGLAFAAGDIRTFVFPDGAFDYVLHAATETSAEADTRPAQLADSIILGALRVLRFCDAKRPRRLLYLSSGAVYGSLPVDLTRVDEEFRCAPDQLASQSVYGESKRAAEMLCAIAARDGGLETVVARIFAAVGPGLPLDGHFAIGNFIRDALHGRDIHVASDGTALRSYIYSADLTAWLLTLLTKGRSGLAYNVGSDRAISIGDLAARVRDVLRASVAVNISGKAGAGAVRSRYVPDVSRARAELGLDVWTPLEVAIQRTAAFSGTTNQPWRMRA
jgi:dTDP-glucose 4,6-dehydratase